MLVRVRVRDVALLVALVATTSCSADGAGSDPEPPEATTTVLAEHEPSGATRRPGFRTVRCVTEVATVSFLLPDRLSGGGRCMWRRPVLERAGEEGVTVAAGLRFPLRRIYEAALTQQVDGGDAATSDLAYDDDAPGPGDLPAESLVYTEARDGSPIEKHLVQAGGVRIKWAVEPGGWGPQGEELAILLGSLRVQVR